MVGGALVVVAVLRIILTGTVWLLDRRRLGVSPIRDGSKAASPLKASETFDQNLDYLHRSFIRLQWGVPWVIGAFVVGIALAIIGGRWQSPPTTGCLSTTEAR